MASFHDDSLSLFIVSEILLDFQPQSKGVFTMKEKIRYMNNRKMKEQAEKIFEGISNGRKTALDNWFKDRWISSLLMK